MDATPKAPPSIGTSDAAVHHELAAVATPGRGGSARAHWSREDTGRVLEICDKVFGAISMGLLALALVCWYLGKTSGTTVGMLTLFPIINLSLSRFGHGNRVLAEVARIVLNAPLLVAIHAFSDGALQSIWVQSQLTTAGCALIWPALTRKASYGHASTALQIGLLALAAAIGGEPTMVTLWRCLALGLLGVILSTAMSMFGVVIIVARNRRAEAELHKRELQRSLAELDERTRDLRLVLDSVAQGFITIDRDGVMASERSTIVDTWFGEPAPGATFDSLLARHDPEVACWFTLGLESLRDGYLPPEVCLEQLPRRVIAGGRTLDLAYRPLLGDERERMLLIVSDATEHVERERAERGQREIVALFQRLTSDRAGVDEFLDEASDLVASLAVPGDDAAERRAIHTLKGICSIFGLEGFAERCHRLEQELADTGAPLAERQRAGLAEAWREQVAQVHRLLGGARREVIEIERAELAGVIDRARQGGSGRDLAVMLATWWHEPVARRFERLGSYAASLALRLDKGVLEVVIETDGIRLDAARWAPLWAAVVHAVRNAVDHGLEDPRARAAAGKPARPQLRLTAERTAGGLTLALADDGVGVDWELVRQHARARGLAADTRADLERALFTDGFTTRDVASQTSGRGVGLPALRATVEQLGGHLELDSVRGRGTTLRCRFPDRPPVVVVPRAPSQPIRALA